MVIVDTSILIDHLRRPQGTESQFIKIVRKETEKKIAISVITIQELFQGQSSRDSEKKHILLLTISPLKIIPYTYETAQLAGELTRDQKRPMKFADAAIAATAILGDYALCTRNTKDFIDIKRLRLLPT